MLKTVRAAGTAALVALAVIAIGCGSETAQRDLAKEIPLGNPSPNNPLKDVNMKNEFQFKEKIGQVPPPH